MQRIRLFSIVVLIALSFAAGAADLPPAPAGFAWERLTEIKADLLKPTGWTLQHSRKGESETYNLNGPKSSGTITPAFALNWVRDVPGKAKMSPSKYAVGLTDAAAENHKLLDRVTAKQGALVTTSFRFEDTTSGREGTMVRYQFFANDQTGSLYVTAFEASAKDWAAAWKTGRVIFEKLRLDESL